MTTVRLRLRPWRLVYTVALTIWAVHVLGWLAALFLTAIQIDIEMKS